MFAREGKVITKVLNIFCKKLAFEIILKTLPILIDLMRVVDAPKLELVKNVKNTLSIVPNTTKKSKMFHPFVKYSLKPYAINLVINSRVKIIANI